MYVFGLKSQHPDVARYGAFATNQGCDIPKISTAMNFELKGHILNMLKDITFSGKDHKDVYKHINKVHEVADYFNIPNVTKDALML